MVDLTQNREFPPFAFGDQPDEVVASLDDYVEVGKLIVQWAKDPDSRPASMEDFRNAVAGHMTIDEKYKRFRIEQADSKTADGLEFVLRLPPKGQVTESEDRVTTQGGDYPLPPLYSVILPGLETTDANAVKTFYARVADYTMRSCR